jgi:hypothetical protein
MDRPRKLSNGAGARLAVLLLVPVALAACHAPPPPEAAPGCNPIVGDDCLTPFPSSFFLTDDATRATGVHVAIADAALPTLTSGQPLSAARLQGVDGFSPAMPLYVYFKEGVDPTQLPGLDRIADSTRADSAVQIFDYATGTRVPLFAELDANALTGGRQALIVRPMTRLHSGTRYVVALVGLHDPMGKGLAPAPFKALRDRGALSNSLGSLHDRYEDLFQEAQRAGLERAQLSLLWDFVTASEATATAHLIGMRDAALTMADAGKLTYTISNVAETADDPYIFRTIQGTFQSPSFLASDAKDAALALGADGMPVSRGPADATMWLAVPQCARTATAPIPIVMFGHGLFSSAQAIIVETDLRQTVYNKVCAVYASTDWLGLSTDDVPTVLGKVVGDPGAFPFVTDRLQQAHVNMHVLTRLLKRAILNDPALAISGRPVTDGSHIYYIGGSDGGIQGGTFLSLSPDVDRGILDVPGAQWSLLLERSSDFVPFRLLLSNTFTDALDLLTWNALMQSEWDHTDPATFTPHLLTDPLPGSFPKQVLIRESIGDSQVSNVATRVLARLIRLPGLALEEPVFGVDPGNAPLPSAYTQWDFHPTPVPPTSNTALMKDNGVHMRLTIQAEAVTQMGAFFTPNGKVTLTCSGTCSF